MGPMPQETMGPWEPQALAGHRAWTHGHMGTWHMGTQKHKARHRGAQWASHGHGTQSTGGGAGSRVQQHQECHGPWAMGTKRVGRVALSFGRTMDHGTLGTKGRHGHVHQI